MFSPITDLPRRALHLPRVGRPLGGAQVGGLLPRLLPRGGQVAVRGGAGGRERIQASANQRRFPKFFLQVRSRKKKVPSPRKQILLTNLTTNSMHELKVRGATRSIYNESVVYRGDFSESQRILLKLNCEQVSQLL